MAVKPFRVKAYLHSDKETMEDCAIQSIGRVLYNELPKDVQSNLRHMLYEVEFELDVDPLTGDYKLIRVIDGKQVLSSQE
jgi:hypothetical protein